MSLRPQFITAESTMKDTGDSSSRDEKQDATVPALPSERKPHVSRRATVWRMGRIAVKRPRWRRLFYALFGVFLIAVWASVTAGFAVTETKNQNKNAKDALDFIAGSKHDNETGYFLLDGELVEFDPEQRELTVSWSALWLLNGQTQPFGATDQGSFVVGLYANEMVYVNNTNDWGYSLANSTALPIGVFSNPWQNYDTGIDMSAAIEGRAWREPQYGFPFDKWTGNITFGATFRDCKKGLPNNISVIASNDCATYWDYAYLSGSIINWKFTLERYNTCDDKDTEVCNMLVMVNAERSGLVVFACIVAVIVNWLSTIFIFVMTMEGVVMQHFQVIEGPQLLAVCFTALFALPSVRSILPGAPEFGALIDLVGIVPNVIIISLCTTMVAVATLRKLIHKNNEKGNAIVAQLTAEPV